MIYTGIGSREIPDEIHREMFLIGKMLGNKGWMLRSGAADGADAAFEEGCDEVGGKKEIFLPWVGFNNHSSDFYDPQPAAFDIASRYHPNWNALTPISKKFMARNSQQVLGELLYQPTDMVICYTPDGCESNAKRTVNTGGTGQAISIADKLGIPIINLKHEDSVDRLVEFLKEIV